MLKVVFDTVVFVRSLLNPYGLWGRLIFQHSDRYRLFVSTALGTEVLAVFARPELRRKFRVTQEQVVQLAALFERADVVTLGDLPALVRDPKDDMVLATAVAAHADYLVTEDRDLLDDFHEYRGVRVVDAVAFMQVLEGRFQAGE